MPRPKLGRTQAHREATIKNVVTALVQYESVTTTHALAREAQRLTDRMIRVGKEQSLAARRRLFSWFPDRRAAKKILEVLVDRYRDRTSGYTSFVRLHPRKGDGAETARVTLMAGAAEIIPESAITTHSSGEVLKSKTKRVTVRRRVKQSAVNKTKE